MDQEPPISLSMKSIIKLISLAAFTMIPCMSSIAQNMSQPPEPIVVVNDLWDMKQTFSKAYDYCIETYKDSSSVNIGAKERWNDKNREAFSKIDGFFERFLELRLEHGNVDGESQTVEGLLSEYNQAIDKTVLSLFSSFGIEGGREYCSDIEASIGNMTEQLNSELNSKEEVLEAIFN